MEKYGIRTPRESQIMMRRTFEVFGDVINYNGNLQLNIRQIRKAEEGEYNPADYMRQQRKVLMECTRS